MPFSRSRRGSEINIKIIIKVKNQIKFYEYLQQGIKPFTKFPRRGGHWRLPRRLQHPVVDARPMSPQGGMWAIRQVSRDPVPFALSPMPARAFDHRAERAIGARISAGRGQAVVAPGFIRMDPFLPAPPALIRHRRPLPSKWLCWCFVGICGQWVTAALGGNERQGPISAGYGCPGRSWGVTGRLRPADGRGGTLKGANGVAAWASSYDSTNTNTASSNTTSSCGSACRCGVGASGV